MTEYILKNKKNLKINSLEDNINNIINLNMNNISPLRYPGGKSKACKVLEKILIENFDIKNFEYIISPFFGGGSFEFYIQNKYNLKIIANDKFFPLYNFWNICKIDRECLYTELYNKINNIDKNIFIDYRKKILNEPNNLNKAIMYFIINRCSFSGATLSGGFSLESSKKRFTNSSIDRIKNLNLNNFEILNNDFEDFINNNELLNIIIYLDPPYYLEKKSKLYGNNGDMHENFDHIQLFNCISTKKNWIMTYNNCKYIKDLYKNFKIIETNWIYGMNKTKKSSEIVIIG